MILRFVAPVLGAALDVGTLNRTRVQVFLRESMGYTVGVCAVAVSVVLPEAAGLSLDELGDRLADELDRIAQLDIDGDARIDTGPGPIIGSGTLLFGGDAPGEVERPVGPEPAVPGSCEPVPERFGGERTSEELLGLPPEENHGEIPRGAGSSEGTPCRVVELPPRPRSPPRRGISPLRLSAGPQLTSGSGVVRAHPPHQLRACRPAGPSSRGRTMRRGCTE